MMGVSVIQLTSKNYHENILASLQQLWLQGHLSDITVQVDYQGDVQEFQAHQVILAASSGYFKKILLSQESATPDKLLLSDMHFNYFSKFLEFAYTGRVEVARDKIGDVLAAAQYLDCENLAEVCGEAMSAGILQNPTKKMPAPEVVVKDDLEGDKSEKGTKRKKQPKGLLLKKQLSPQSPEGEVKRWKVKTIMPGEKRQVKRLKLSLASHNAPQTRLTRKRKNFNDENQVSNDETKENEDGAEVEAQPENSAEKEDASFLEMPTFDEWECEEEKQSNDPEDALLLPLEEEEEEKEGQSSETSKRTSKAQFQCNKCQRTFHYERSYLKHIR